MTPWAASGKEQLAKPGHQSVQWVNPSEQPGRKFVVSNLKWVLRLSESFTGSHHISSFWRSKLESLESEKRWWQGRLPQESSPDWGLLCPLAGIHNISRMSFSRHPSPLPMAVTVEVHPHLLIIYAKSCTHPSPGFTVSPTTFSKLLPFRNTVSAEVVSSCLPLYPTKSICCLYLTLRLLMVLKGLQLIFPKPQWPSLNPSAIQCGRYTGRSCSRAKEKGNHCWVSVLVHNRITDEP